MIASWYRAVGRWLIAREEHYDPVVRISLVRTLTEDAALALGTIGLNQIGWLGLLVANPTPSIASLAVIDLALWFTRRHYRGLVETAHGDDVEAAGRNLAGLNFAWSSLIAVETVLLLQTNDLRGLVYAMFLSVGERGYTGTLYAGFPRLAHACAAVSTLGLIVGLLTSFSTQLAVMVPLAVAMSFAFHFLNRRVSTHLLEAVRARQSAHHQVRIDALTGLANRVRMDECLSDLCKPRAGGLQNGRLLYIDLDGFKTINDQFGHPVGDLVLVEVAHRLRRSVRSGDLICRLGGDEFIVIMPSTDDVTLRHVASAIVEAIERPIDGHVGTPLLVSASLGVAEIRHTDSTPADILRTADAALYTAKKSGKGRFVIAS